MAEQHRRFHKNSAKDGSLRIPIAVLRYLNWLPGTTVYIITDAQTLVLSNKEQIGKQNHTLKVDRWRTLRLSRFILSQANIDGRTWYALDAVPSESNGTNSTALRVSAA